MKSWLPFLSLFLAGFAPDPPPAASLPAPDAAEEGLTMNAWMDPGRCNLGTARPVDLRKLLADSAPLQGHCIAISGIWAGPALFLSHADTRRRYAAFVRATEGRRVGIYAHLDVWAEAPRHARPFTLVGMVGHCEINQIWGGYCHHVWQGPIIIVAEAHEGRRSATDRLRPAR